MRLFFTRHGKVASNEKALYNGVTEEPLTHTGKEEAHCLGKSLEKKNIQKIISSSSLRAVQTAQIIRDYLEIKIETTPKLKEINFGIFENKSFDDIKKNYSEIYLERKNDKFNYRIPDGESYRDIYDRVYPLLIDIAQKDKPVLLVTHATVIKVLLCTLTGSELKEIEKQTYHNTCLFEFDVWLKDDNIKSKPIVYNCTEHLKNQEE